MTLEVVAALFVGVAVIVIILAPLASAARRRAPIPDLEELEETPKGVALAALREIEFDRATGKLSDEDYRELRAKYGAAALEVLRLEAKASDSAAESQDPIEGMIGARLRMLQGDVVCPRCGPRPEPDAAFCSSCGSALAA